MPKWTVNNDMPSQAGRVVLITGANSGLGYETSLAMGFKGATVVMACRNMTKGQTAHDEILAKAPNATLDLMQLDLSDLDSVKTFADEFRAKYTQLDLLFNNAGVMALPYSKTAQGFEMQFGTNHLGHFALTNHLLDMLIDTPNSRIINITSQAHAMGGINFDDINWEQDYERWAAYSQSKLANVLFTRELNRRMQAAGIKNPIAVNAQPGLAQTQLQVNTANSTGSIADRILSTVGMNVMSQSQEMGVLNQLYAATMPNVHPDDYYSPVIAGFRGWPSKRKLHRRGYDDAAARKLWDISVDLTGITYDILQAASASA